MSGRARPRKRARRFKTRQKSESRCMTGKPVRSPKRAANVDLPAPPEPMTRTLRITRESLTGGSRLHHYLDAVVLLVVEDAEAVRRVVEPHAVSDDERGVYIAVLDPLQQLAPVALYVALPRPHRKAPVHERAHRELVYQPAVDAYDRDRPAVAAGHDRLAQGDGAVGLAHSGLLGAVVGVDDSVPAVGFEPDGVDAGVGAAPARHLHQGVVGVDLLVVDHVVGLRALLRHPQALGQAVDADDALGAEQARARHSELPDGAAAPDGDGVARLYVAHLGAHVAGREDVGEE